MMTSAGACALIMLIRVPAAETFERIILDFSSAHTTCRARGPFSGHSPHQTKRVFCYCPLSWENGQSRDQPPSLILHANIFTLNTEFEQQPVSWFPPSIWIITITEQPPLRTRPHKQQEEDDDDSISPCPKRAKTFSCLDMFFPSSTRVQHMN